MAEAFGAFKSSELEWREPFEGVRRQVVTGAHATMCLYHLSKGQDLPQHQHPQEQIAYVISGKVEFIIGEAGEKRVFEEGAFYCLGPNVKHGARFLEDSVILDVFAPAMTAYDDEAAKPDYAK